VRHSKQIHIFATRSDLEQGLRVFEAEVGVKYVRCDLYYGPTFEQYFSLLDWEGLGSNNTGDHITGPCFLALKRDVQVNAEAVPQNATPSAAVGKVRYDVNQKLNPDSVSFLPGGIFNDQRVLVCGHIGTASGSPISLSLYKTFVKAITKGFEKVGAYRVGRKAASLMHEGYRMVTIGINSPRKYDLARGSGS
jgi:hypothetical protein